LDLGVGDKDTTEGDQDTDDERINEGGEDGVGGVCGDKLTQTSVEEPNVQSASI
jgi:hypothetical protein